MLNDVVFSPDSKLLITLADDQVARIWNVGDYSKEPCELKVTSGNFLTASFSHDRARLVAVIHDQSFMERQGVEHRRRQLPGQT